MKFIRLEMLNLASLDRREGEVIDFEEGPLRHSNIFSIVGPTGSGKSTILDAICLALYNRAPRYPRKKGDRGQGIEIFGQADESESNRLVPTDPRNILTRGKKEAYSKLTFSTGSGHVYRAEWSVRFQRVRFADPVTALYRITQTDGEYAEEEAEWSRLPEIIGLEYEQFLRTVLIAQGSFSDFLKAKEDERYQLLEKLTGCGELYTGLAAAVRERRDEAVDAHTTAAAAVGALKKDIMPPEELEKATLRLAELEAADKGAREELRLTLEALAWHETDARLIKDIEDFGKAFAEAQSRREAHKEDSGRLALHDATLPATALYGEMKTAETQRAAQEELMASLGAKIAEEEKLIQTETEVTLAALTQGALKAKEELDRMKPRINKARELKARLETLGRLQKEKGAAEKEAALAHAKAGKDLESNAKAIETARASLDKATAFLNTLRDKISEEAAGKKKKAEEVDVRLDREATRLEGREPGALQQAKTEADDDLKALGEALRIRKTADSRLSAKKNELSRKERLAEQSEGIAGRLKTFDTERLSAELDTLRKTYTLMTSERWAEHRAALAEGEPCPLCGAEHHPYSDAESVEPVVGEMKDLIDEKAALLARQREEQKKLGEQLAANSAMLKEIDTTLKTLDGELAALAREWDEIHGRHGEWPADAEALALMLPAAREKAEKADAALREFNELGKLVDRLRKEKEKAEKALRLYEEEAQEKTRKAEKAVTDADTRLKTEKGKTATLQALVKEKAAALKAAGEALEKAKGETSLTAASLKEEIGESDPDALERQLEEARQGAEKGAREKADAISQRREQLNALRGRQTAAREAGAALAATAASRRGELAEWLTAYNEGREQPLAEEGVAELHAATDDWEAMRAMLARLAEAYTAAETTLRNGREARAAHQEKRPEASKEELLGRKERLEARSDAELVETKTRLRRHEDASAKAGELLDREREAALLRKEWEEIVGAIGTDGKTLRKIAQCYTLRFLVEHANDEIRKFNSRYELRQVKNSLGLRVIDHDRADDERDVTSLSGGETFIVSLGLALGLSALSSRNIRFDNLFIDEGFGTLDPDSLATVIDALAMLQTSQGKKVGVISHTDTMSERITTQIRIIKHGNSGSSHIEIHS